MCGACCGGISRLERLSARTATVRAGNTAPSEALSLAINALAHRVDTAVVELRLDAGGDFAQQRVSCPPCATSESRVSHFDTPWWSWLRSLAFVVDVTPALGTTIVPAKGLKVAPAGATPLWTVNNGSPCRVKIIWRFRITGHRTFLVVAREAGRGAPSPGPGGNYFLLL